MMDGPASLITLDTSPERLVLRYVAPAPAYGLWTFALLAGAGVLVGGLGARWGTGTSAFALVAVSTGIAVLVTLAIIFGRDFTASVTTTFDQERRNIRVETVRRRGGMQAEEWGYHDVQELRLISFKSDGSREETLALQPQGGAQVTLAWQRQTSHWDDHMAEVTAAIRGATRLPGPEVGSLMAAAGWMVGASRG